MIYLIITIVLVFLSYHYDYKGNNKNKDLFYKIVLLCFILLAGLRFRLGIDTTRYLFSFYHEIPDVYQISSEDLSFGKDPLFMLLNSIIRSIGGRFFIVQLIHAFFVNYLIFKYIKKHSGYIFTCVLFYFLMRFFAFNMEEMRASMSIAVCLFANDYVLDRKRIKGYLLYIVACFFHASACVMLVVPFLFFIKLNFKGIIILGAAFLVGRITMSLLEDYRYMLAFSDVLLSKSNGYLSNDELMGNAHNLIYYVTNIIPYYLYAIWALLHLDRKANASLFKIEPLLMMFLLFLTLQTGAYILYRFVSFFIIYFILFIVPLFYQLTAEGRRRLSVGLSLSRSTALFSFLFLSIFVYYISKDMRYRFYPYSSVIEKSIDEKREKQIRDFGGETYRLFEY